MCVATRNYIPMCGCSLLLGVMLFHYYRHGHGHSREYGNGHDQAHGCGHGHGHGREQGNGYDLLSGIDRDLTLMLLATWPCHVIDQASAFF